MSNALTDQPEAVAPARISPRSAGHREAAIFSDEPLAHRLRSERGILAECWIVYGVIRLIAAVVLVVYAGTATLMFGALLNRVPDPFTLMGLFHFLYAAMIALSVVCGIMGFVAGVALLAGRRRARSIAVIAGLLSLSDIPLGTALGGYTLVVLLSARIA